MLETGNHVLMWQLCFSRHDFSDAGYVKRRWQKYGIQMQSKSFKHIAPQHSDLKKRQISIFESSQLLFVVSNSSNIKSVKVFLPLIMIQASVGSKDPLFRLVMEIAARPSVPRRNPKPWRWIICCQTTMTTTTRQWRSATAIEEGPGQATKANRLRGSGGVLKILGRMGIWER